MIYLKITAANKTVTIVSPTGMTLSLGAASIVNNVSKPGLITAITYGSTTISAIPAYDGTNTLYQFGKLSESGHIQAMFSN